MSGTSPEHSIRSSPTQCVSCRYKLNCRSLVAANAGTTNDDRRTKRIIGSRLIRVCFVSCLLFVSSTIASNCQAQLTDPRIESATESRTATLEEILINQLRATTDDRKVFLRLIVQLVDSGQFEQVQVIAISRWAIRKNPRFPFPYFERAMRFEAEKRDIELPPVQLLAGSAAVTFP